MSLKTFKTKIKMLCREENKFTVVNPSDVVLLEGILVFYHSDIRDMFDMKLFVDTDADTRLARRGTLFYLIIRHSILLRQI